MSLAAARGDNTQHHHPNGCAAEHQAKPNEDAVGHFAGLLVHAEAQHREEGAKEHHHEGKDFVRAFFRIADCSRQHQR